jgi:uncharacterized protein (TIGR03089 family)
MRPILAVRTVQDVDTSTFPQALHAALRGDAARPFVTFYDDATGERVELSLTTYANWVHKTASLVQDELDVERGALMLLDLPTHWTGPVWLGAAWACGLCVTTDPGEADSAELVVCGPARVQEYAGLAADRAVVALSLRPLGGRFTDPLPDGVVDYGAVVLAQPDAFVAMDPPRPDDAAVRDDGRTTSQQDLLAAARDSDLHPGGRLLTDVNPASADGAGTLAGAVVRSGSTIWVANPDAAAWDGHHDTERATAQRRGARS